MSRRRWFLKEWRKHRGYSQERLAEMIGSSKGYISDLESGKRRYNEDLLDALSEALRCAPADLLMRDPTDTEAIWSLWEVAKPGERRQIVEIAKTITTKTGTD